MFTINSKIEEKMQSANVKHTLNISAYPIDTSLLAEGRAIAVPTGDVKQTSEALLRLVNDLELCRQMGRLARNYVAVHHTAALFRRTLMRATFWSGLDVEKKIEATEGKNSQWQR